MVLPHELDFAGLVAALHSHEKLIQIEEYASVLEKGRRYPLLRMTLPGARVLVVTSGFHGEEPAGPLTLAQHLPELVEHARARGVGLRIYPCLNPSGFEGHHRYNASGEKPNNDFLRYELESGEWVGELGANGAFRRWELYDGGPQETRIIRAELASLPTPAGALDLHQDDDIPEALTYAYTFGDKAAYRPLIAESARYVRPCALRRVDVGRVTDADGLIEANDGSITDYYLRRGVRWCAALETTTNTPLADCHRINLIWLHGFIDLCARD